ncbi:MAG: lipoprotein insertase outer membrane protein LolB [Motiliproteus sp.]
MPDWRNLPLLFCATLLGCSSQPSQPPQSEHATQSWEQRQQQLSPLTQWQVLGKIRIQTDDSSSAANLNWTQRLDHYRIYMAGPLGQGAINIEGSEQTGITLDISGEGRQQASSPEQLLAQRLGWAVPISQMPYWIRGVPAPKEQYSKQLDPSNRLRQLQQSGWTIDYIDYHEDQQPQLPHKIRLNRDNSLKLLLILKQWQFDPLTTAR